MYIDHFSLFCIVTDVPAVLSDCGAMLSVGLLVVLNVYKKICILFSNRA